MESNSKRVTLFVVLLIVLVGILAVFFVRDKKESVIERKTTFIVPEYCTIEDYKGYGSIFKRSGFEAKIRIDTAEHMNGLISQMHTLLGDDYHEITLQEFAVQKYSLFANQQLVPNPTAVSWVIVGPVVGGGKLVVFMCVENNTDCYMYMYYAE